MKILNLKLIIMMMCPLLMLAPNNEVAKDIIKSLTLSACSIGCSCIGKIYSSSNIITTPIAFALAVGSIAIGIRVARSDEVRQAFFSVAIMNLF